MKQHLKRLLPEKLRDRTRTWRARLIGLLAQRTSLVREPLAQIYLQGEGVEYGALNWPLRVPKHVKLRTADFTNREGLIQVYPEHASVIREPDFVCSLERLEAIADQSLDFFIANHVIEHVEDPIAAMKSIFRVLKVGGIAFISLPDKRYTFDQERDVTPWEHLVRDHQDGGESSRLDHYRDGARYLDHLTEPSEIEERAQENYARRADLHFHVWTQSGMLEFLSKLQREFQLAFDIEALSKTGLETIFVLRKSGG